MNVLNRVTMKTLRRNRARTVVTIIGVILSAAMFTAVTTFISTMQHYMLASVLSTQGSWHAQLAGLPYDAAGQLRDDPKIKAVAVQQEIGYARLPESQNDYKPYWYIQALDDGSAALLGIRLVEGRMPQNAGELLVPEHVLTSGGVAVKAGDTLTLSVGDRLADDGSPLTQTNPYNEEEPETIRIRETKAYTVVGICSRPSLEPYSAPGFTAFSALDTAALASDSPVILTFEARHIRDTAALAERYADAFRPSTTALHDSLLDFSGSSSNSAFNAVLYSMGAVLMGLILIGSVSLIYNAFAISVSERSKQFGMLAGVGATSRQIRGSVFFEAGFIGLIGVPVGILSGIAGIGVTLFFLGDAFASMNMAAGASAKFELSVSPAAVIVAAVIAFATILISAYIPARRASRVSAIEAIRQTGDVKLTSRQVKTSRLSRKLFGMEGDLALKNFKRNRRRYRATVISLVVSIVLFVSASSFTHYMSSGTDSVYGGYTYDVSVYPRYEKDTDRVLPLLAGLSDVEEYAVLRGATGTVRVPREALSPRLLQNGVLQEDGDGYYTLEVTVQAFGESAFSAYLKRLGLDPAAYRDPEAPKAVVQDAVQYYHDGKRQIDRLFSKAPSSLEITGRISSGESEEEDAGQAVTLPLDIGAATDAAPIGSDATSVYNHIFVYVSDEVYDRTIAGWDSAGPRRLYFTAKGDASKLSEEIRKTLAGNGILQYSLTDIAEMTAINRNMLLVVNVFSYGFIVLISLITTANVLNTISTNINLRRREFAMLKSVGITPGGFNRMMNFECVFYGLKALLYGLPLSLLATYLIYLSMSQGLGMAFTLPWTAILIASASVFLVVFVTMMYSMSKIKKENIVDALKNENL